MPIANNICSSIVLQWGTITFSEKLFNCKKQCKVLKNSTVIKLLPLLSGTLLNIYSSNNYIIVSNHFSILRKEITINLRINKNRMLMHRSN